MKIKLCGFTESESLKIAIEEGVDFFGFVFYNKSPRNISIEEATNITSWIVNKISKVAVVVNPEIDFLKTISQKFSPNFFQFHGQENSDFILKCKSLFPEIKIIKAISINNKDSLREIDNFIDIVDFILLDSKNAGSGKNFDWNLLKDFKINKEWILSGGINIENLDEAINKTNARILDISSGIEEIRGVKSPRLIKEIMQKINQYRYVN